MAGLNYPETGSLALVILFIAKSLAALNDCPRLQYFNGSQCAPCSGCPPGFGQKTKCTSKEDTECEACYPGFDYSNTSGYEPCILCDTYSNCLEGYPKILQNCTVFGPRVCDGCEDGHFFDLGYGENGGCVPCSNPCNILEDETRPCTHKHDRMCKAKSAGPTISGLSNDSMDSERIVTRSTSTTSNRVSAKTVDLGLAAEGTKPTATLTPKPWVWIVVAPAAIFLIALIVIVVIKRRRGRNPKRDEETNRDVFELQQRIPLMPPATGRNEQGLDLPIKDLTIDGKKFIAQLLNDRDNFSFFYWEITAEKLGLAAESRAWKGAQNPTGMLLTTYGEKAGSTLRNLIKALKEADLTHFAAQIEKEFSDTTQD